MGRKYNILTLENKSTHTHTHTLYNSYPFIYISMNLPNQTAVNTIQYNTRSRSDCMPVQSFIAEYSFVILSVHRRWQACMSV